MKVAIIGSGGREHSILKAIKNNPNISTLFAIPGNAGMSQEAICLKADITNHTEVLQCIQSEGIDFVIVSPDNPLVEGMVDVLESNGIACFGPRANAAIVEGSKIFAKEFMHRHSIPTAPYWVFDCPTKAKEFLSTTSFPKVIKADGLALGKGVIIAKNLTQGHQAIEDLMENAVFGESGKRIVIEEFLEGKEATILAFTDGKTIVPMVSSMDYKKALDGDEGLNTGGMGCIAPNPYYTEAIQAECMQNIFLPTLKGLNQEGRRFKGCLYFGLMLTTNGVKVIEYNCRFGDPETQTILPLLESDLFEIMLSIHNETLKQEQVRFKPLSSCCVVVASEGYPQKFQTNHLISYSDMPNLFFAGVKQTDEGLVNSGGRVLSLTCTAPTLQIAREQVYKQLKSIRFANAYYRKDIGKL
ncbi:phosphoribosylamine--glycine ligase [Helicobacter enhydrae]|uniref:Phosphoribosylamine--glycine ligase n=1 Tax=Helicobacter enhydrae TaxID=222136 RepID=A0A1B1U5H7_9HELI|nr:phosphoribosylamine--glycine ligase [Helicobacter enhydrae]ANV98047.1 phosphoribosylamine--glycine ligase [Helicobacter enhydrae]